MSEGTTQISRLLSRISGGDRDAFQQLMPKVYAELRAVADRHMQGENRNHSLQPTELVHEAYLRLLGTTQIQWQDRSHFMAMASTAMRRALVDHARAKNRKKRGEGAQPVSLTESVLIEGKPNIELLDLEDALEELAEVDDRKVRVVELLYFGGLTAREAAEVLEVTPRTVERDWRFARAWLFERLSPDSDSETGEDAQEV
jgi:RNA polymerase sigma factor (TIGR02999 family)